MMTFKRTLRSLTNVSGENFKYDTLFKIVSLLNLVKKGSFNYILHSKPNLIPWRFSNCIVRVRFDRVSFCFYCVKNKSFNVFMNPYFHEFDISTFIFQHLKEGDTFVDVGAMGGLYTIIASKIVGNEGHVFSVEPNPDNLFYFGKNIELNNLHNVTLFPKAVGEKEGEITLHYNEGKSELTSALGTGESSFQSEMVTLDSILERESTIKILKVDTEGYDLKVLKGATKTLEKTFYVIVETNIKKIKNLLVAQNFKCETIYPSNYLLATRTF
ncbi:MAG: FkbM family methyltransferase [Candidatus Jordarchaeum sp.]|uniref:FkbM family methyltransferase n=1 Tax=Candidatus Jordarchaeum sp. TaxID=2823881 RepID=UPI004049C71B